MRTFSAFISHSSKDAAFAMQLVASLEARGLTAWVAPRDVNPGAPWAAEIDRGIAQSACFILVLSGAANLSQAVLNEVTLAFNKGKPVFAVRIEDVAPSEALNFYVASIHWIDALDGLIEDRLERLIGAMRDDGERERRSAPRKKVEDPFTVPLTLQGFLPPPRTGEHWVDVLTDKYREILGSLHLGKTKEIYVGDLDAAYYIPRTLFWGDGDNSLIYGASERVYAVNPAKEIHQLILKASMLPGRLICDMSRGQIRNTIAVVGTNFRSLQINAGALTDTYLYPHDEFWFSPGLNLVDTANDRPDQDNRLRRRVAQLGRRYGLRSDRFLARQFGFRKRVPNSLLLRIDEPQAGPTRLILMSSSLGVDYSAAIGLCWSNCGGFIGFPYLGTDSPIVIPVFEESTEIDLNDYRVTTENGIFLLGIAWHPSKAIYASHYIVRSDPQEFGFAIIDAESRTIVRKQPVPRLARGHSLVWSPDGSILAMGGLDEAIFLWDFRSGKASCLAAHKGIVGDLHFSPDGRRLLSCSDSGDVLLWDPQRPNQPIASFKGSLSEDFSRNRLTHRIKGSAWSPSGRMFTMFSGDSIRVLELA